MEETCTEESVGLCRCWAGETEASGRGRLGEWWEPKGNEEVARSSWERADMVRLISDLLSLLWGMEKKSPGTSQTCLGFRQGTTGCTSH